MFLKDYPSYLGYLFARKVTPFVLGSRGVGKTASVAEFCEKGGHKLFNLRLGNMADLGDLLGLADFVTDGEGNKVATRFMMPDWQRELFDWATANPSKYAVIHMDEATRVPKHMQNPVLQIALEFRLHNNVFPSNVRVIASGNPPTKDYDGVISTKDQAYWDRFCVLKLTATAEEWLSYQRSRDTHVDVLGFIQEHPQLLFGDEATFSIESIVQPSGRSMESAALLYADGAPQELIFGLIGGKVGSMMYQWIADNKSKVIQPEDILEYKKATKVAVLKLLETERRAEISSINTQLVDFLTKREEEGKKPTKKQAAAIVGYMMDLPDDLMFGLLLNFFRIPEVSKAIDQEFHPELFNRVDEAMTTGKVDIKNYQTAG